MSKIEIVGLIYYVEKRNEWGKLEREMMEWIELNWKGRRLYYAELSGMQVTPIYTFMKIWHFLFTHYLILYAFRQSYAIFINFYYFVFNFLLNGIESSTTNCRWALVLLSMEYPILLHVFIFISNFSFFSDNLIYALLRWFFVLSNILRVFDLMIKT